EQSCSAPRQADDEDRLANFLLRYVRINLAIAHEQKPIAQNPDDIASQRHFPNRVEPRFAIARIEQTRERFGKIAIAEIVELRTALCFLNQRPRRKWLRAHSEFLEPGAALVEQTNGQRCARFLDRIGAAHTSTIVPAAKDGKSQVRVLRGPPSRSIIRSANGESDFRRGLSLRRGRNLPKIKTREVDRSRLYRWQQGKSELRGCLQRRNWSRRGRAS